MNSTEFLDAYPNLGQTLLNSKFLDIIPGGFSIATDVSCQTIVHNPITAKFLRIKPWDQFSYSSSEQPNAKVYHDGKPIVAKDLPIQRAAWNGEVVERFELEFIWEDGVSKIAQWSACPLHDKDGTICGAISTMMDVTEMVQMARELDRHKIQLESLVEERTSALRLSEERFSKVFRKNPQMVSIIRKSDYRFIDISDRFLKAADCPRDMVIGKTLVELGMLESEFESLKGVLEKQGSINNMEIITINKENSHVTLLFSAEQIKLNGEECIIVTSSDITKMKQIQVEMSRLDRLNLVGQMAAGIGHEIRNPMTTVRGYLQLLGAKQDYQSQKAIFELMISELDRANSIITEFLSLTRNQPTKLKFQSLNNILNNLYPMLESNAYHQNKKIEFIPGKIPDIQLDPKEIHQLVLNLCHNGLEAMKEQACLTICTFTDNEMVVLSIQDEGCGIEIENVAKLGTPFFTTKESGTGLGLAMCYSIAANHTASIEVDTGPQGTTFFVRFNPLRAGDFGTV